MTQKTENSNIMDPFIIFIAIVGTLLIGYISIEALENNDDGYGFMMLLASLLFAIALSFGISKTSLKYYFWSTFGLFTAILMYLSYSSSNFLNFLISFVTSEFILILMFGIYYALIRKKL
ncbi:hypothetical protein H0I23_01385 [Cellulophaga sp. HaHaR_3_176]|uniref:hypothetical protein n=1 Tax=Cellulophaga sp. HaHaR_3_176 TaxID=1942464 RepID=UPI001C1F686B|nr:hypothetical protein [Cellulophaga sp. HaHaR_3_176]QWX84335.1 hypothetical protein H0I23_01385 [Cellulophaga sp. HaHaR_3_176]